MRLYALFSAGMLFANTGFAQIASTLTPEGTPDAAATQPATPAAVGAASTAASTPAARTKVGIAPAGGKASQNSGGFRAKFEAANTSNDGKLTKDQAKAGHLTGVFKNFDTIDADHKGYVTLEDIKVFRAAHTKRTAPDAPAAGAP